MRVLVAPAHEALVDVGSEYHLVYDLLTHLAAEPGVELDVLTGPVEPSWTFPANVRVHPLMAYKPGLTLTDRIKLIWLVYRKARQLLRERRYDVIHYVRPFKLEVTFSLPALLGLTKGTPFVVGSIPAPQGVQFSDDWLFLLGQTGSHTPWWRKAAGWLTIAWIKAAMKAVRALSVATLRRAQVIVGASEDANRAILRVVPGAKVVAIPCGPTMEIRPKASYAPQAPRELLAVGYFVRRKNFSALLDILARVVAEQPEVVLRLVGFGPEEERLKAQAQRLGLSARVVFEGRVAHRDVAPYYRRAELFLSTSLSETDVSPSCLEAMGSGLPVVVMDTPGFRPLVEDGVTGCLLPQGEAEGFARAVLRLLGDQGLRERLGRAAYRLVSEEYPWPKQAHRYAELYRELAGAGRPG